MNAKQGIIIFGGENIQWERLKDRNKNEYFVYRRFGYPNLIRREFLAPEELLNQFETDLHVRLTPTKKEEKRSEGRS